VRVGRAAAALRLPKGTHRIRVFLFCVAIQPLKYLIVPDCAVLAASIWPAGDWSGCDVCYFRCRTDAWYSIRLFFYLAFQEILSECLSAPEVCAFLASLLQSKVKPDRFLSIHALPDAWFDGDVIRLSSVTALAGPSTVG
jgi:hypothetical protein